MIKKATEPESKYPELTEIAFKIAFKTGKEINNLDLKNTKSEIPYKRQFILEEIIRILEEMV